jgi:hypothetical protein
MLNIDRRKENTAMAAFDQRGQTVVHQYNAKESINIGTVQNGLELIGDLKKIRIELLKAAESQVVDAEVLSDADYQITKAIQQVEAPQVNPKSSVEHLNNARSLLEGVTALGGIVTAIDKVIQVLLGFL